MRAEFYHCGPGEGWRIVEFWHGRRKRRVSVKSKSAEDAIRIAKQRFPHPWMRHFKCLSKDETPTK